MALTTGTLVFLSVSSVVNGYLEDTNITTNNGGKWGIWGSTEKCPKGYKVKGVSLKVEGQQFVGDDTAINGIRLHCFDLKNVKEATIQSTVSQWGSWGHKVKCRKGHVEAYQTQVEPPKGLEGDDTALNNIKVKCFGGEHLEPKGSPWGSYGPWSQSCNFGVCGIRTKVEPPQGGKDDTALNDLVMICCDR